MSSRRGSRVSSMSVADMVSPPPQQDPPMSRHGSPGTQKKSTTTIPAGSKPQKPHPQPPPLLPPSQPASTQQQQSLSGPPPSTASGEGRSGSSPPEASYGDIQAIISVLGLPSYDWKMSEETLRHLLVYRIEEQRRKTEEEKRKQIQMRLELRGKDIALVQEAVRNDVPPELIPQLFSSSSYSPAQVPSIPMQHTGHRESLTQEHRSRAGSIVNLPVTAQLTPGAGFTPGYQFPPPAAPLQSQQQPSLERTPPPMQSPVSQVKYVSGEPANPSLSQPTGGTVSLGTPSESQPSEHTRSQSQFTIFATTPTGKGSQKGSKAIPAGHIPGYSGVHAPSASQTFSVTRDSPSREPKIQFHHYQPGPPGKGSSSASFSMSGAAGPSSSPTRGGGEYSEMRSQHGINNNGTNRYYESERQYLQEQQQQQSAASRRRAGGHSRHRSEASISARSMAEPYSRSSRLGGAPASPTSSRRRGGGGTESEVSSPQQQQQQRLRLPPVSQLSQQPGQGRYPPTSSSSSSHSMKQEPPRTP